MNFGGGQNIRELGILIAELFEPEFVDRSEVVRAKI